MQIEFDQVTKRYGDISAVDRLSFDSAGGEVVGLLGSNGAGKTTTVRLLLGLANPDEGHVNLQLGAQATTAGRQIGYAPQETGLLMSLTVRDNLHFWAGLTGISPADADTRVAPYVERLDIGHRLSQRVANLSVGEQRKVQLLTAVLHAPRLLVLDEPTAFLDVPSRREVVRLVREFADEGCTVIYSTHVLAEAEELCDTIVVLHRGHCLYTGSIGPFVSSHATAQLAVKLDPHPQQSLLDSLRLGFDDLAWLSEDEVLLSGGRDDDPGTLLRRLATTLGDNLGGTNSLRILHPGLESAVVAAIDDVRQPAPQPLGGRS